MARPALSATRAVAVLNFLAAHAAEVFTLSDLAARLGINLASTHAVLAVLTDAGYLARHPRRRTFTLGPAVVALGTAALERHAAIEHAAQEARRLSEELGLEVAVTAPAGDDIVFLARVGEHRPRDIGVQVGQRVPLVPPVGSVFVAWGDAESWLAHADNRPGMEEVLADVRSRGLGGCTGQPAQHGLRGSGDTRSPSNLRRRDDCRPRVRAGRRRRRLPHPPWHGARVYLPSEWPPLARASVMRASSPPAAAAAVRRPASRSPRPGGPPGGGSGVR